MISAEEARALKKELCVDAQADLLKIEDRIKSAVSHGSISYCYNDRLHKQAMQELIRLGYELREDDSQIDGYSITIIWGQ